MKMLPPFLPIIPLSNTEIIILPSLQLRIVFTTLEKDLFKLFLNYLMHQSQIL